MGDHEKNTHRYSISRLNVFRECPMKHHYEYIEQIPVPENEYTLSGTLLHKAMEYMLTGKDIDEVYKEWYDAVDNGLITLPRDQLEYTVNQYFAYYYYDTKKEQNLLVEKEFEEPLDNGDYFTAKVDHVYMINGLVGLRDHKSTRSPLKYEQKDVYADPQLLTYVVPVEKILDTKVDFIEIDEIRLAKLAESVPLIQRGRPSTDKEALSLVTADLYRQELEQQDLLEDPKYARTLEYLEQRGHPLFRRVKVHLSNRNIIDTNNEENENLYKAASLDIKYKIKDSKKCFMCPFRQLCMNDEVSGGTKMREMLIENMY